MKISNLKFGDLQLVETGKNYGPMSYRQEFYKANMPENERRSIFMASRMNLGSKYGFCGRHMFVTNQIPTNGSFLVVTKQTLKNNFSGFPDTHSTSDILIISSDTPDVVIGGLHKENPVLMLYDTKERILGVITCPNVLLDRKVPFKLVDVMTSLGLKRDNLYAYISKSAEEVKASEEQIEISHLDRFAEMDQNGTYSINPKEVLKEGLINRGITNIETSKVNTTYDYESYYGKEMGYNFTGGFLMSENNCKRLRLER